MQPSGPPNERPAPATTTTASPWAASGELEHALRHVCKLYQLDVKHRPDLLTALEIIAKTMPHLTGSYGWQLELPTARGPSLGVGRQPPAQGERSNADDRNFGRYTEPPAKSERDADRRQRLSRAAAVTGGVPDYRRK